MDVRRGADGETNNPGDEAGESKSGCSGGVEGAVTWASRAGDTSNGCVDMSAPEATFPAVRVLVLRRLEPNGVGVTGG